MELATIQKYWDEKNWNMSVVRYVLLSEMTGEEDFFEYVESLGLNVSDTLDEIFVRGIKDGWILELTFDP